MKGYLHNQTRTSAFRLQNYPQPSMEGVSKVKEQNPNGKKVDSEKGQPQLTDTGRWRGHVRSWLHKLRPSTVHPRRVAGEMKTRCVLEIRKAINTEGGVSELNPHLWWQEVSGL